MGPITVNYRAIDNVGNEEAGPVNGWNTATIYPDEARPSSTIEVVPSGWVRGPVIFTISATDEGSGVASKRYRMSGATTAGETAYSAPVSLVNHGVTLVEYWSVDAVGNEEQPHKVATVKIDKIAPTTTADAKATYEVAANVKLTASDGMLSGVAKTEWRLDGGAWTAGTSVSTSKPGAHKLEYKSTDKAGNVEAIKSRASRSGLPPRSLTGPSSAPAYNGTATVKARLRAGASGPYVSGKSIIFEKWSGSAWVSLGASTTDADGYATKSVAGLKTRQSYRARFIESSPYWASNLATVFVNPKVRLTRSTSWTTRYVDKTYYAKGYIEPRHYSTGGKLVVRAYKKRSDGSYHYESPTVTFSASSRYAYYSASKTAYQIPVKFPSKGMWAVKVYHAADSKNAATYGSTDYVAVK